MSMIVWQNGRLLPEEEVKISPFDPGFTVGQGIFETMLAVQGKIFAWDRHLRRFQQSAKFMELKHPELTKLESAMHEVVLANTSCRCLARVRITLTEWGNLLITAKPIEEMGLTTTAVEVDSPVNERSPLSAVKTLSYAENFLALGLARDRGASEAIRPNMKGDLCEASLSNVFFVKDGTLHTPALDTGCLPGITRELILECCPDTKVGCWPLSVLADASEVWLSNSIRRLQWVSALGKRELGEPSIRFYEVRGILDELIAGM